MARSRTTSSTKRANSSKRRIKSPGVKNVWVQRAALPVAILAGVGVIAGGIWLMPGKSDSSKTGVGANGFSVYEMKGVDIGIGNVVNRATALEELDKVASSVGEVKKTNTLNFNGNKGQTATFAFKTKANTDSAFYVDVMRYKSKEAYDSDDVFSGTGDAGSVDGLPVRFMHAATIGKEREYAVLVTKDLNSYKFAITQPNSNITISEGDAHEILKRIADRANLSAVK